MLATRGPGLLLAGAGGLAAVLVHRAAPVLSPTLVAVLLGFVAAVSFASRAPERVPGITLGTTSRVGPGLAVASRTVLRCGVALLGLRLALDDVLALGWPVLVVVVGVVALGIAGTLALARWLGVDADSALLVACGFSICGAAAIAAVDGVRRARQETVATAVSLVVVFGSLAMLALPLLALGLGLGDVAAGAWSGAAIQEVGQVVVAGGLVGGVALQVAVVVKLGRVLLLAPVLTVLSWRARRSGTGTRPPLVPAFVALFVALAVLRSTADVPAHVLEAAGQVQQLALATGMFALGCALSPATLARTGRPLVLLAAAATVLVALLALPAAYVVG